MSNSGLFSIARSALLAQQQTLQTISQNIANAQTPGYSRQEAVLSATPPVRFSYGSVGTGVEVATIIRKRDVLLDDTYRSANGNTSQSELHRDLLGQMEGVFGEPSDSGLSNALGQLWSAFSDLATSPSSGAAKAVVQQTGRQVAQLLNQDDTQITQQRTSSLARLTNTVADINNTAQQIAALNQQIITTESNGNTANDLRDARDLKVDSLSKLAGVRVLNQPDGSTTVLIGNSTLVDGNTARTLTLQLVPPVPAPAVTPSDVPVKITLGTSQDALYPLGGELKALTDYVNTDIPAIRGRLDALASQLASGVNAQHVQGYTFTGNTIPGTAAGNFFDAGTVLNPVRASTIRLDAIIDADSSKIASSRDPNAPTDGVNATAMSNLRGFATSVSYVPVVGSPPETGSFDSFFRDTMTKLGISVKTETDNATIGRTLTDQADQRRLSVSGVNTDEELSHMMQVQQAYQAASKLVKAADEMLQTLLQII